MAPIILRNLGTSIERALRERATQHGRSVEDEVREIVQAALRIPGTDPHAEFKVLAARLREQTPGVEQTPAEMLQSEGRRER